MIRKAKHLSILWSRSALLSLQESNYRHRRAEPKRLKFPCYLFELRADFLSFVGSAFHMHRTLCTNSQNGGWAGSRPLYSYIGSSPFFSGWRPHCMPQNKRDIHPIGAGHAIAAGRAGNPERGTKRLGYASYTACFSAPMEPGSASPATFTFSASCSRVLIPLSTTVTSG